jgi:hypothetical protein
MQAASASAVVVIVFPVVTLIWRLVLFGVVVFAVVIIDIIHHTHIKNHQRLGISTFAQIDQCKVTAMGMIMRGVRCWCCYRR